MTGVETVSAVQGSEPSQGLSTRIEVVDYSNAADGDAWNTYVARHPLATNYHQWEWKTVIEQSFGHRGHYLLARQGRQVVGVLPLIVMKSRVFGRFVISLPFVNYGGILASHQKAEESLATTAQDIARGEQAQYIELRHQYPHGLGLSPKQHKVTMTLTLEADADKQWKGLDAKVRNQIRKAQKSGLTVSIGGKEYIDDFYAVFSRNMRDLGTPVYGKSFFQNILTVFHRSSNVVLVKRLNHPVAVGLAGIFANTLELPWAASVKECRSICGNMLLYWETIRYAVESGLKTFDFGRSTPGSSTYQFKKQWGADAIPLTWEYWLPEGTGLPDLSPANPKYRLPVEIWKQLPLSLANRLGPMIARSIP